MRINCPHCESPARVTARNALSPAYVEVYADCKNPDCSARFVVSVAHKHDLIPPGGKFSLLSNVLEMAGQLSETERAALRNAI